MAKAKPRYNVSGVVQSFFFFVSLFFLRNLRRLVASLGKQLPTTLIV